MNNVPETSALYFEDVNVGSEIPPLTRKITTVGNVIYCAATWDFYRVHYDSEFVKKTGFSTPFADGQIFGAFLAKMLTSWTGSYQTIRRLKLSYRVMTFVGDTVTCGGGVVQKQNEKGEGRVICNLWIRNQKGVQIISDALATLSLPSRSGVSGERLST